MQALVIIRVLGYGYSKSLTLWRLYVDEICMKVFLCDTKITHRDYIYTYN